MEPTPRKRGASRMREQGYVACNLWLSPKEYAAIRAAAQRAGKPIATWVRDTANATAALSQSVAEYQEQKSALQGADDA